MPKIDLSTLELRTGSIYPEPFASQMAGRSSLRIGTAGGLTQFGANLVFLEPGASSSLRHWHLKEDEFVMVTEGILMLHEDEGETEMRPGDCACFPANTPNGHRFVNRSDARAAFLVIGTKAPEETATYSDEDLLIQIKDGHPTFHYRDGTDWEGPR
ncbi:MAG: transcriptional regulator [Rhodobacteraceae bacterium]|nr:transcriptional regulator [Paracoccaceae bacterium]